jgi:hypothetical protein
LVFLLIEGVPIFINLLSYQQFHFLRDNAFLVGRPFSSFIGPGIPPIRAQNDFLLFDDFESGSNLEGGVVTAIESFDPGFSLLYEAIPFLFNPPSGFFPSFLCQAAVSSIAAVFTFLVLLFQPPH